MRKTVVDSLRQMWFEKKCQEGQGLLEGAVGFMERVYIWKHSGDSAKGMLVLCRELR